jgi:hypothetical protein
VSDYSKLIRVAHLLNPTEVVINAGEDDGVLWGQTFIFFALGVEVEDPVSRNSLGRLEVLRGRGTVIHLQQHMATVRSAEVVDEQFGLGLHPRRTVAPFRDIAVGDFARPV